MFWIILLYIYFCVSFLGLVFVILMMMDATIKLKKKYPDAKYEKDSKISIFVSWIRLLIISLLPIINIILIGIVLFKWDDLVNATIEKMKEKMISEKGE